MAYTRHIFQPLVSVIERSDGRYDVEFDWAESYMYAVDDDNGESLSEQDNPMAARAQDALELFLSRQPHQFVISAARSKEED